MPSEIKSSRIPGFYNLTLSQRLEELAQRGGLSAEDIAALSGQAGLTAEQADHYDRERGGYLCPAARDCAQFYRQWA